MVNPEKDFLLSVGIRIGLIKILLRLWIKMPVCFSFQSKFLRIVKAIFKKKKDICGPAN